jgi:beta-lactam-binding protein with PASTA domain
VPPTTTITAPPTTTTTAPIPSYDTVVPNFVGMTYGDADSLMIQEGFDNAVGDSGECPPGVYPPTITDQDPVAGTVVEKGSTIGVDVCDRS